MKKINRILVWLGVLSLVLAAAAWAQPAGPGGRGGRGGPGRQYNPQAVETVKGEVTQVQQSQRRSSGVHLQVKTDKETLMVILGPAYYLDKQNLKIAPGDKVEITGSRVQTPQQILLIAAEVKKGGQVVKLRDEQGNPLWQRQWPGRRRSN